MDFSMNSTLDYYNSQASNFFDNTVGVDFSNIEDRFLKYVPEHGLILDFGCGSGRDTKYFLDRGFQVEAIDGSEELCKAASRYTGIEVKHCYFSDLDESQKYDGIWACASILHERSEVIPFIFSRMEKALKSGGALYVSFKYGSFEGERGGRYFTDMTEERLGLAIKNCHDLVTVEEWVSTDARPDRCDEKWLNAIFVKRG